MDKYKKYMLEGYKHSMDTKTGILNLTGLAEDVASHFEIDDEDIFEDLCELAFEVELILVRRGLVNL